MSLAFYRVTAMRSYRARFPTSVRYAKDVLLHNLAGGKRVRSRLVNATAGAFPSGQCIDTTPLCTAVELVHAGFLMADDCCDKARYRRGDPTWWTKVGVSNAWNDANMLCFLGKAVVRDSYQDHQALWFLQQTFDEAMLRTIVGQHHDMRAVQHHDMATYQRVAWLKTGYYTFWLPIVTATALAAPRPDVVRAVVRDVELLGNVLAEMYQSQNDMQGVADGDPSDEELGRPTWIAACKHHRGPYVDLTAAHEEFMQNCENAAAILAQRIDAQAGAPIAQACLEELGVSAY